MKLFGTLAVPWFFIVLEIAIGLPFIPILGLDILVTVKSLKEVTISIVKLEVNAVFNPLLAKLLIALMGIFKV